MKLKKKLIYCHDCPELDFVSAIFNVNFTPPSPLLELAKNLIIAHSFKELMTLLSHTSIDTILCHYDCLEEYEISLIVASTAACTILISCPDMKRADKVKFRKRRAKTTVLHMLASQKPSQNSLLC